MSETKNKNVYLYLQIEGSIVKLKNETLKLQAVLMSTEWESNGSGNKKKEKKKEKNEKKKRRKKRE